MNKLPWDERLFCRDVPKKGKEYSLDQNRPDRAEGRGSVHIDRLRESELQSSIFRRNEARPTQVDFSRIKRILGEESQIPPEVIHLVLTRVQDNLEGLGLNEPTPALIAHWITGLLQERGFSLGEISLQSLELSLGDVELSIFHPIGGIGATSQNPESTSQKIAQRIKTQFACRRIFTEEVVQAHDEGRFELLHLGAVDRPHDVFLTPDYLKRAGLPVTSGAPSAGPAKRADVLLGHLIRFTHELQNHFAGDIQWGYLNTLLLPYLVEMNKADLRQFVQQLLFEFAQLDAERGGLYRKVILDLDFDMPRQLVGLPVMGPGGKTGDRAYGAYGKTLTAFNEACLECLEQGDYRRNPFHSPLIVFHLNQPKTSWSGLHQKLAEMAFKWGNPSIAFSYYRRNLGPMGHTDLKDPDFLKLIQNPSQLRGFSSSSIAINFPRLCFPDSKESFASRMQSILDLAVAAHRQKRLFISRLMAFGNRGPLQFLRHRIQNQPFLKIDQATQPMQVIGLGEAAALRNGSPTTSPEAKGIKALDSLTQFGEALAARNKIHKLSMFPSSTKNESVAYRFAFLDWRQYGSTFGSYLLTKPDQSHPIYSEGPNILAFTNMRWRDRLRIEGQLHGRFMGFHALTFFVENPNLEDPSLYQKLLFEAQKAGVSQIQIAPDLKICMKCFFIFSEGEACPDCLSTLVGPYGYCQSHFSPIHSWCLGKRAEWLIRHRLDQYQVPVQKALPLGDSS